MLDSFLKDPRLISLKARPPPSQLSVPVGDGLHHVHSYTPDFYSQMAHRSVPFINPGAVLLVTVPRPSDFLSRYFLGTVCPSRTSIQVRQISLRKPAPVIIGQIPREFGLVRSYAPD